jgi:hypothetical protein
MRYVTFAEYVEQRDAGYRCLRDTVEDSGRDRGSLSERSRFRGVFAAVNPSRPASPTSSQLLASPYRRRLGSQVVGRSSSRRRDPGSART